MKYLSRFLRFDSEAFFKDKYLIYKGSKIWRDYNTGEELGYKLITSIIKDDTDYGENADEDNQYEKLMVKVPKRIDLPLKSIIRLVNPNCTVYGDYRTELSVRADDVQIIKKKD